MRDRCEGGMGRQRQPGRFGEGVEGGDVFIILIVVSWRDWWQLYRS